MKAWFYLNIQTLLAVLILFFSFAPSLSKAQESPGLCVILNSDGAVASTKVDALFRLLTGAKACPAGVVAFKKLLSDSGLSTKTSMVANRGIHNPTLGSFSFFEVVTGPSSVGPVTEGEFYFGHFTGLKDGAVVLDKAPARGKLMIELIVWDPSKKLFNFYELIGKAQGSQWFYRGDSADILKDNERVHLIENANPFGSTLRCSACHASGGPIMKEISAPHNDWWTTRRPLEFAPNKLSDEVAAIVSKLTGAETFTLAVRQGIQKLESSAAYQGLKSKWTLKAQLRPLFCEMEINLMSDLQPMNFGVISPTSSAVDIPSAAVVNPLIAQSSLKIKKSDYQRLLSDYRMKFPETLFPDADHAWLAPVKGYSDLIAIQTLIKKNLISSEFAEDVLAIDMAHPIFSAQRCALLQLVPENGNFAEFAQALKSSAQPGAKELYANLTDPKRNAKFHAESAQAFLTRAQSELGTIQGQRALFERLLNQRQAVFTAVISKNPRGQILEPGFRVIFPQPVGH